MLIVLILLAQTAGGKQDLRVGDVVAGDFNGDKRLDVAVLLKGPGDVAIWHGDGQGGFARPIRYATKVPGTLNALAAGDFNGDKRTDLAVANADDLFVWLEPGPPARYRSTNEIIWESLGTDLNRDGRADLLMVGGKEVFLWEGQPDGRLVPRPSIKLPLEGTTPTAADLNGDGRVDLAVALSGNPKVAVLLNQGNFSFRDAGRPSMGGPAGYVVAADFNGDRKLDLATVSGRTIRWLLGDGKAGWTTGGGHELPDVQYNNYCEGAFAFDYNRDGIADLVTGCGGNLMVFPGGKAGLGPGRTVSVSGGSVVVGDFNGDKLPDMAVSQAEGMGILLGRPEGDPGPVVSFPVE